MDHKHYSILAVQAQTDIEKVALLLDHLGINYWYDYTVSDKVCIIVETQSSDEDFTKKVVGYAMFFNEYQFDLDGNFLRLGIWE